MNTPEPETIHLPRNPTTFEHRVLDPDRPDVSTICRTVGPTDRCECGMYALCWELE